MYKTSTFYGKYLINMGIARKIIYDICKRIDSQIPIGRRQGSVKIARKCHKKSEAGF